MVKSFEEVVAKIDEPTTTLNLPEESAQTSSLTWPIAIGGMLVYTSLTAFLPHIVSRSPLETPLYFSATFFIVSFAYLLAWAGWFRLAKKLGVTGWKLIVPLLAIPVSVGLFYLIGLLN